MKHLRWIRLMAPALVLAASVVACDVGQVTFNESGGSALDQGEIAVRVRLAPADSLLAERLDWEEGVPGAWVKLLREGRIGVVPLEDTIVVRTDSTGRVTVGGLRPGDTYRVSASRRLTASERDAVRARRPVLFAFGGGTKANGGQTVTVRLDGNRRRGLLFSEFYLLSKVTGQGAGSNYDFGGYVELYNNSDRTVYLDGRVIGPAFTFDKNFEVRPCRETMPFQNDSTGIWAHFFQAFPGSGTEHPLPPGETVVVATDAIDHRKVAPEYPDLRDADFEFRGPSGPDNPEVPDMQQIGLGHSFKGHGLSKITLGSVPEAAFLSDPVDVDALRRGRPDPANDVTYVFIPAEKILDAFTGVWGGWDDRDERFCAELLHDRFDKLAMIWDHPERPVFWSAQRGVAGMVGGQPVLLDTNTSEVDFRLTRPRTPGTLPPFGSGQ